MKSADCLILSAGKSERMGDLKPLLNYKNQSFLANIIIKTAPLCKNVLVVLGHKSTEIEERVTNELIQFSSGGKYEGDRDILSKVTFVTNPGYEKGMYNSLQKGLSELSGNGWIIYHFADQPGLPEEFYSDFLAQVDENYDIIQPLHMNRKGHPLLLNEVVKKNVLNSPESSNLRLLIREANLRIKKWECSFPGVLVDIDRPSDLELFE